MLYNSFVEIPIILYVCNYNFNINYNIPLSESPSKIPQFSSVGRLANLSGTTQPVVQQSKQLLGVRVWPCYNNYKRTEPEISWSNGYISNEERVPGCLGDVYYPLLWGL